MLLVEKSLRVKLFEVSNFHKDLLVEPFNVLERRLFSFPANAGRLLIHTALCVQLACLYWLRIFKHFSRPMKGPTKTSFWSWLTKVDFQGFYYKELYLWQTLTLVCTKEQLHFDWFMTVIIIYSSICLQNFFSLTYLIFKIPPFSFILLFFGSHSHLPSWSFGMTGRFVRLHKSFSPTTSPFSSI